MLMSKKSCVPLKISKCVNLEVSEVSEVIELQKLLYKVLLNFKE